MNTFNCNGLAQISECAKFVIDLCKDQRVWVFKGELGAGKTTLIQEVARQMNIIDRVSSPTFSLVNEYQNPRGDVFYHFDFYRIDKIEEAIEIGVDEYFNSGAYCWVEWGERIAELIPENFALIELLRKGEENRDITVTMVQDGD
ncbi:tRNA (adenosine(37)-N6)-threonylcarbamoyltransferase complex ATPase subunit type 1 TsaE [Pleomorphovibrio marinus]|uniref:tRNA (adenosine(37)-N6)-threonylcarbamoyltransferase complex ATPase subunit type 1 TsaE n=1 Tax=Pleomorphovibrio marinus TaxID=2164132 RepID=UPI000E0C6EED|nr:tRNA (adenosine(37)-N6)-threonylcarbamoyltransferase complex ATPase subunit type 1 TsaE [Pleomorphovibrio marinus]